MLFSKFKPKNRAKKIRLPEQTYIYREIENIDGSPNKKRLLIGLHGHGSNERQIGSLVNPKLTIPHVYVALRGFLPLDNGFTWLPFRFEAGEVVMETAVFQQTLSKIATFIELMQTAHNIPPERTDLIGYSLGAGLSLAFTVAFPSLINRGVALSGQLLPPTRQLTIPNTVAGKPLFLGYGTRDPLITPANMADARHFLQNAGVHLTYREFPIPHVVSQAERDALAAWLTAPHAGAGAATSIANGSIVSSG